MDDFSVRYTAAKKWRDTVQDDIKSVYRFCDNERRNDFNSNVQTPTEPDHDTFISIGEEMATDLAGDLVNFFMPQEARWAEYDVTAEIPQNIAAQVEKIVQAREDKLFDLIEASNLADAAPAIMFEAASHGTPAIWVTKGHLMNPVHVEVVPPNELLLVPGHMGWLDRFREHYVPADTLEALFDGTNANLSDPVIRKKMDKDGEQAKVCWGYWVDWSDPAVPLWKRHVKVENKTVLDTEIIGPLAGACPLLVGRFNPRPKRPWGRGPGRKALPDLKTLNKIEEVVLTKLDEALDPAYSGVDDGILEFREGIQAGKFYPRRAGSDAPEPITSVSDLDYGFYSKSELEQRIRVAFYQDGPRQTGDTPPTATQWVDERRRIQQRLGKPSAPLWTEMILPLIQRFEYIGVMQGLLEEAITHDSRVITVQPRSPLQKSHNQDQVVISRSNLDLAVAVGQDQVGTFLDPVETFKNIVKASGDKLTVIRDQPIETAPTGA